MLLEVPYSPELVEAVWLAAGGTILAAQSALRDGFGSNLTGFHHAYPAWRRFCAIHDVPWRFENCSGWLVKKALSSTRTFITETHAAIFKRSNGLHNFDSSGKQLSSAQAASSIDLHMRPR